jgi:TRAP-type C4-dicarboxylate transport system permease small subunit
MLRTGLDALYRASGALAAVFLAAICAIVVAQVGANIVNTAAKWLTGDALGLVIPSYAEFAGMFLAASSFLALAYTLRGGAHIRVTLVIQGLGPRTRRWVELWCAGAGALLSGYFAWHVVGLMRESLKYDDVSPGMIAIPLWLPQAAMVLGLVVLTVALVDDFVAIARGREPGYGLDDDASLGR